jgi:hypothetical protein
MEDLASDIVAVLFCSYLLLFFSLFNRRWNLQAHTIWWTLAILEFVYCLPLFGV